MILKKLKNCIRMIQTNTMQCRVMYICLSLLTPVVATAAEITWDSALYDPAAERHGETYFLLPMPCGGAMAFQKIDVPVDFASPLGDRKFRMGTGNSSQGYTDYLRFSYLRGAFDGDGGDTSSTSTHYYMARYELTTGQQRALLGDCERSFTTQDRRVAGGISWFDAVDLSRRYSEWLAQEAADVVPRNGESLGFVRIPTEAEWEFAARGGNAVRDLEFGALRHPMDGALSDYARFQGGGARITRLSVAGVGKPNPLGLFDMLGHAEEVVLEPFRLNALGRAHGQAGGLVSRGGSYLSTEAGLYSARRAEWPLYSSFTREATAPETLGVRFVLASHVVEITREADILQAWDTQTSSGASSTVSNPERELRALIEDELDPARRALLEEFEQSIRRASQAEEEARQDVLRALLYAGAVAIPTIRDDLVQLPLQERLIRDIEGYLEILDESHSNWDPYQLRLKKTRTARGFRAERLDLSVDTYHAVLTQMISAEMLDTATDVVPGFLTNLSARGQDALIPFVEALLVDVGKFALRPDLDRSALIDLAKTI